MGLYFCLFTFAPVLTLSNEGVGSMPSRQTNSYPRSDTKAHQTNRRNFVPVRVLSWTAFPLRGKHRRANKQ